MAGQSETSIKLNRNDYTVGWICALPVELTAAQAMLDEIHSSQHRVEQDTNSYVLGRVGMHNVAIASLPKGNIGAVPAATAAAHLMRTFPKVRFGLRVGIGSGVPPHPYDEYENDVRLGDVVVSTPTGRFGGIVQYDFGKDIQDDDFKQTGSLNQPPTFVLSAIVKLIARHRLKDPLISEYVEALLNSSSEAREVFKRPSLDSDVLFQPENKHIGGRTCTQCDYSRIVERPARDDEDPVIHYGLIGSGNCVMRNAKKRIKLQNDLDGLLCLEMEAAGLMNTFPCLVVRGICDYADTHENETWQPYAAAVAAAYCKELLGVIEAQEVIVKDIRSV